MTFGSADILAELPPIYFETPDALWLIAGAAPVVLLSTFVTRANIGILRRLCAAVVRCAIVALGVLALAGPWMWKVKEQTATGPVVVVEDRSASVADDPAGRSLHEAVVRGVPQGRTLEMLSFAEGPWREKEPPRSASATDIELALDAVNQGRVDLVGTDVVLLTDGRATHGSAAAAAARLSARGGRVHVLPVGKAREFAPRIAAVEPPADARKGMPTAVRVTVQSHPANPTDATVKLLNPNGTVADQRKLRLEGSATLLLRATPENDGAQKYSVALETTNDPPVARPAPLWVEGPPRLLVVDTFPQDASALAAALKDLKMPVDLVGPDRFPEDLSNYAAVVLSDLSGNELTEPQRDRLRDFVEEDGSGLVFVGGPNVVASRWRTNPLAEVLPVSLREPPVRVIKSVPDISVCFVVDYSGSMGQVLPGTSNSVSKLELVKASMLACLDVLPEIAQVAVVAFDSVPNLAVPPTKVTEHDAVRQRIENIRGGGGTAVWPGVDEGLRVLSQMKGDKYIIVLTDGQSTPPPSGSTYESLADRAKKAQISWTSVAVGIGADQKLLKMMSDRAGGQYIYVDNGDDIPRVFVDQAKAIRRMGEIKRSPFEPRPGPHAADLKDLAATKLPALDGAVPADAKPATRVQLLGEKADVLLVDWQFGAGRVAAYCSDVKMSWSQAWLGWEQFSRFWEHVVGSVAHARPPLRATVRSSRLGNTVRYVFRVTDEDGNPAQGLKPDGRAATPGDAPPAVTWTNRRPGLYEAKVELPATEQTHDLEMTLRRDDDGKSIRYLAAVTGNVDNGETTVTGPDPAACREIALAGNGLFATDPGPVIEAISRPPAQYTTRQRRLLWPIPIGVLLALWPIDVWLRKTT